MTNPRGNPLKPDVVALRKKGLPDEMALENFDEIEAANRELHAQLLARMRMLEESGIWDGMNLPWADQREAFERDQAEGVEYPFIATQSKKAPWGRAMQKTVNTWRDHSSGRAAVANKVKGRRFRLRKKLDT